MRAYASRSADSQTDLPSRRIDSPTSSSSHSPLKASPSHHDHRHRHQRRHRPAQVTRLLGHTSRGERVDHADRPLAHSGRRHNPSVVPRPAPPSAVPCIPSARWGDRADDYAQADRGVDRVSAPTIATRQTAKMIFTPEEKAEWLDACRAMLDGEPIEFRSLLTGQWIPADNIEARRAHRRKPVRTEEKTT